MTEIPDVTLRMPLADLEVDVDAGVARYRMTPDGARRLALGLNAEADGLRHVEGVEVRGQG